MLCVLHTSTEPEAPMHVCDVSPMFLYIAQSNLPATTLAYRMSMERQSDKQADTVFA